MEKSVLITGAYRGLGLETGKLLAAQGWKIYISARKEREGKAAVEEIRALSGQAEFLFMDMDDAASISRAAAELSGKISSLDCLINNAAYSRDPNPNISFLDTKTFEQTIRTNVLGVILTTQAFYPLLKKSAAGRVVNISSGLASLTDSEACAPAYSISKTALNMVTKQFAMNFAKDHIAVNAVCPGWCKTEMGGPDAPRPVRQGAEGIAWLAAECPQSESGFFWRDRQKIAW